MCDAGASVAADLLPQPQDLFLSALRHCRLWQHVTGVQVVNCVVTMAPLVVTGVHVLSGVTDHLVFPLLTKVT